MIAPLAMQIGGTPLRSLHAIHLATAASIGDDLGVLIACLMTPVRSACPCSHPAELRRHGSATRGNTSSRFLV